MSLKDIRQTFEHELKVSEEALRLRLYNRPVPEVRESEKLEGRPMAAPSSIRGLAGKLREHIKRATERAEKLGDEFGKSIDNLHHRLDETDALKKDMDAAAAEIQDVIGTPNGGPPLEK